MLTVKVEVTVGTRDDSETRTVVSLIKVHLSEFPSVLESILRMRVSDRQISSPESAGRSDLLWHSW